MTNDDSRQTRREHILKYMDSSQRDFARQVFKALDEAKPVQKLSKDAADRPPEASEK